MGNDPFVAAAVAPEFGASHVEDAPVGPPSDGLFRTVGFSDEREQFAFMVVHVL